MGRVRAIGAALLAAVLVSAGAGWLGLLPPLGSFLDPAHGVWAVAATAELPARARAPLPGLSDSVTVLYDRRGVPHIFAATELDAVRALGFVVARDRLFQLEIQTRAPAGTLTELVGPQALAADREQRRLGLARSAERAFAALAPDARERQIAEAYAAGVTAYLKRMSARELPLEYRLLRARPFRWEPVYSLYLHRRMSYTLSYRTDDLARERLAALVREGAADALMPVNAPIQEPIAPGQGREYPRFDRSPLPAPPVVGESEQRAAASDRGDRGWSVPSPLVAFGRLWSPGGAVRPGGGSNNWAVSPGRSASGHALLAGDPHLELTLPSIWYEVHLVAPVRFPAVSPVSAVPAVGGGEWAGLHVYGVTIPGAPGVVIGFNRDVAWSFTNTEADVIDFYAERLDDPERPRAYLLDGEWRPLERRIETYRGPHGTVLAVDTVYHTHRGPLLRHDGQWLSVRWTALEASGSWEAFDGAARARSVDEWLDAMATFEAPPQNGLVADRAGNIAVRSAGWFPTRPGDGRGTVVRDGTSRSSDWTGRWPVARYPRARNPAQGRLASANQQPVDPSFERGYLGANWYAPWRALTINALLRRDSAVTPEAMRRYQTDPGSARADLFVPFFLRAASSVPQSAIRNPQSAIDSELAEAGALLAGWDRRYTRDNRGAVLFELAMAALERRVWDELTDPAQPAWRVATPTEAVLWRLLHDAESRWWDDRGTPAVEIRDDVLAASLRDAWRRARERHGDPAGDGWRWGQVQQVNVHHLLGLAPLSALGLAVQGGPGLLNPAEGRGTHGASWRMVVELAPEVRAWTIYPGGQSGNPVSPWYDDRFPAWTDGDLDEVLFPRTPDELGAGDVVARLILYPAR